MSTETFAKTSWDWQLSQFQQRIGEWLEYEFYRFDNVLPEISPDWKLSPWLANLLNFLFWLVVVLFVAVVIWRLWREFNPYIYAWLANNSDAGNARSKMSSENLSVTTLLERSQQLYRQGNYREACRCVYLAILQHLHDTKTLLHQPSRTDAEYLQLLKLGNQTPLQPYETLITTHEQLCFGNAQMLPENYQQCRQAYQEITEK
ncbi:MAG TPA: DUF4129 domain-containing protein [Trichormus sp. M33_DOE_039]|nr:DUF4129 domain-containing protein [Trichormus sp. M33_DOE_039]